ncbi:hypothetical protein BLOT_014624 [Blomia tropicalis]|nr:hypothetical protein BLOT_014624 [Blomia tropicalis]
MGTKCKHKPQTQHKKKRGCLNLSSKFVGREAQLECGPLKFLIVKRMKPGYCGSQRLTSISEVPSRHRRLVSPDNDNNNNWSKAPVHINFVLLLIFLKVVCKVDKDDETNEMRNNPLEFTFSSFFFTVFLRSTPPYLSIAKMLFFFSRPAKK